jgi:translation elongation factor P/translation initiation factor 5A
MSVFISFLFSAGCSIFDLKDPAPPSLDIQAHDPLNISAIITATVGHEVAADMNYRYYFTDDVTFDSFNFPQQGKSNILRMLDYLRRDDPFVDWQMVNKRLENNNCWIVEEMRYIVYSKDGEQISGKAEFRIVKESDWMISYWKDMPDDNANAFFKPY